MRQRAAERIIGMEKTGCVQGFYKNQSHPITGLKAAENSSPTVPLVINFS